MAEKASRSAGSPAAFLVAALSVIGWAMTGALFDFSETWQIGIHTYTSIITFLLVILIQNAQNRETRALQLKLDELIRATSGAHNIMLSVEKLSEEELDALWDEYKKLAHDARQRVERGESDQNVPHVSPILTNP